MKITIRVVGGGILINVTQYLLNISCLHVGQERIKNYLVVVYFECILFRIKSEKDKSPVRKM